MTTAVSTQSAAPTPAKAQITTGGALAALVPQSLDDAFRLAKALSSAGPSSIASSPSAPR